VRDPGLLAAAAARPGTVVFGQVAYPTLFGKAAAVLFSVCQNHALLDGNKRLAWAAAVTFLALNGVPVPEVDVDFCRSVHALRRHGSLAEVVRLRPPYGIRSGSRTAHRPAVTRWEALTATEHAIAARVGEGGSNPDIASRLLISPHTVETHVAHILARRQVRSRLDIAREVTRHETQALPLRSALLLRRAVMMPGLAGPLITLALNPVMQNQKRQSEEAKGVLGS